MDGLRGPLYFMHSGGGETDADSSGSIPREMVQDEVRRQVHQALENQRKVMEDLKLENERLRMEAVRRASLSENVPQASAGFGVPSSGLPQALAGLGVPSSSGGLPQASSGLGVPSSGLPQAPAGLGVPSSGLPQASSGLGVPSSGLPQASSGLGVPSSGLPQAPAGLGVPSSGLPQASAGLGVPSSGLPQASSGLGVPSGGLPQASSGLGVPSGGLPQAPAGLGVPGSGLPQASTGLGVPSSGPGPESTSFAVHARDPREGLLGRDRTGAYTDEEGFAPRWGSLRGREENTGSMLRGSSLDRKSSPLGRSMRPPSSSPKTRNGFRMPAGSFRQEFGEGARGLPDGDGYGLPHGERAYRQPPYYESRTFGDYDVTAPPGLESTRGTDVPKEQPVTGLAEATHGAHGGAVPEVKDPDPLAVLITGMTQLQQVLLKKNEALDLDAKGTPELPKLAEYSPETGAIEFQDFLYLAEQQIGSLASGAGEWWQKTLEVSQAAYLEYQALSPVKRLGVKAQLTADLKGEKYRRLERKVAAMLLSALPKGVKDDLIAYRVQGVHQILYRLMVIFQPGGAQDRAQILKQLDVTESAAGPPEAVLAIRRWYRLLQRASDLGVTLPDESLQVKSLSVIVRKTSEQNSDFKFRLALARTELQVDTRPNQASVLKYMQHLLAELEQLGSLARRASGTTTTPTAGTAPSGTTSSSATTSLKGLQGGDPAPKPGAKPKAAPNAKKMCQWFGTDNGCRNGRSCTFQHSWTRLSRAERCLLCGSKKHRAKECPNSKDESSPAERGGQSPQKPQSSSTPVPSAPSLATATVAAPTGVAEPPGATSSMRPIRC